MRGPSEGCHGGFRRVRACLDKIPGEERIAQRVSHLEDGHVGVFKNHRTHFPKTLLLIGGGIGIGFIHEEIGDSCDAEVGLKLLVG